MSRKSRKGQKPPIIEELSPTDTDLFMRAMHGITQLKQDKPRIAPQITTTTKPVRSATPQDTTCQPVDPTELSECTDTLQGCAKGVNRALLRQLQQGHIAFTRQLDLHGYTHDRGHETLTQFLKQARLAGERCVLVITGYGKQSPLEISVLRQALPLWLTSHPCNSQVLAYCQAKRRHGGPGAFYILLKKA